MRRIIVAGAITAAAVGAVPAQALTVSFNQNNYGYPYYTTAQIFESFEAAGQKDSSKNFIANADTPVTSPANAAQTGQLAAGVTESSTGTVLVQTASVPGIASDPDPSNNDGPNYLDILGGGSYTVSFAAPVQFFSFILGSLDAYNSVLITYSDNTTQLLTGSQIVGQAVAFNSTNNSSVAGRVVFDTNGGTGISSVKFSTTDDAFEIDGLSSAVPEPAAWSLMILGIGAAGATLRSRRKNALATA